MGYALKCTMDPGLPKFSYIKGLLPWKRASRRRAQRDCAREEPSVVPFEGAQCVPHNSALFIDFHSQYAVTGRDSEDSSRRRTGYYPPVPLGYTGLNYGFLFDKNTTSGKGTTG